MEAIDEGMDGMILPATVTKLSIVSFLLSTARLSMGLGQGILSPLAELGLLETCFAF